MSLSLKHIISYKLISADITSGHISIAPVLDNRDELIERRANFYVDLLTQLESEIGEDLGSTSDIDRTKLWCGATDLVASDIISGAIALTPILYDRDEKINERITYYYQVLKGHVPMISDSENVGELLASDHPDTLSICNKSIAVDASSIKSVCKKNSNKPKKKRNVR